VVRQFLNSLDPDAGVDALTTPPEATTWLRDHGVTERGDPDATPTEGDVVRLRIFREALRDFVAHGGQDLPPESRVVLAREMERCPLRLVFCGDDKNDVRLTPVGVGSDCAIAHVLCIVRESQLAGTWPRLKVCPEHECRWVFYDSSKNASAQWCSMAVCGNRAKARRFRERHKPSPISDAGS